MEDSPHRFVAKPLAGLAADSFHVNAVRAIQQLHHSRSDLINVSYINQETITLANNCRDATDARRQNGTATGHGLHQHTSECFKLAGKDKSSSATHELRQIGL